MLVTFKTPSSKSSAVKVIVKFRDSIFEVRATTTISSLDLLYVSEEIITAGRFFCETKSVNGIGIRTMSLCLSIVPDSVIYWIIPKFQAAFCCLQHFRKFLIWKYYHLNLRPFWHRKLR